MANNTVLVVDDNVLNLELVEHLLLSRGFVVRTATNSEETLKQLESVKIDLILMDLQLPGVNGFVLTSKLKQDDRYKDIPIVAITAYAMKGDKEKALAAGCDGYIAKPIDTRTLPDIIQGYLEKKT